MNIFYEKITAKKKKHLRPLTLDVITLLDIYQLCKVKWCGLFTGKTGGYWYQYFQRSFRVFEEYDWGKKNISGIWILEVLMDLQLLSPFKLIEKINTFFPRTQSRKQLKNMYIMSYEWRKLQIYRHFPLIFLMRP